MKQILLAAVVVLSMTACNNSGTKEAAASDTMSTTAATSGEEQKEERNKQIALESVRAFASENAEEALKSAAPDVVDYMDGSGPVYRGKDSIMKGLKAWLDAVSDLQLDSVMAFADGDYVAVYSIASGKWTNDYMGMKATGKSFRVKDVDIFKFNNEGQITEHRSVQSAATLANQIGMKMPG